MHSLRSSWNRALWPCEMAVNEIDKLPNSSCVACCSPNVQALLRFHALKTETIKCIAKELQQRVVGCDPNQCLTLCCITCCLSVVQGSTSPPFSQDGGDQPHCKVAVATCGIQF